MLRRGQTEAVGLLVLVILLAFLGLLYLRLSMASQGGEYQDVRSNLQAQGLLRALLYLETGNERFEDMIIDCYYEKVQCQMVEERVKDIFSVALKDDQDYRLTLAGGDEMLVQAGGCRGGIVSSLPFTAEGVLYEGKLALCRRSS